MAISNALVPAEATMTATGTQDDFDFGNTSLLRCDNSSLVTIRGLAAGRPGQRLTLVSAGTGQVDLVNESAGSASANRISAGVNGTISLAAGAGRTDLVYDSTTGRWRVLTHEQGNWISPAFSAGDYSANGAMTWTLDSADVVSAAYYLRGRVLQFNLIVNNSSVGGTPNTELHRAIPGGLTAQLGTDSIFFLRDNGTFSSGGICHVVASETIVRLFLNAAFGSWQSSTNLTNVSVSIAIPVQ